jgi:hypothetical protein
VPTTCAVQFDDLLLLQRGGYQVYSGRLGHNASALVRYLEGIPGVQPLPKDQNVATWMLDVLSASRTLDSPQGLVDTVSITPGAAPPVVSTEKQCSADSAVVQPVISTTPSAVLDGAAVALQPAAQPLTTTEVIKTKPSRRRKPPMGTVPSGEELQQRFYASQFWLRHCSQALQRASEPPPTNAAATSVGVLERMPSIFTQFFILSYRELNTSRRNIPFNLGRIVSLAALNLLVRQLSSCLYFLLIGLPQVLGAQASFFCCLPASLQFGTIYYHIAYDATDVAGLQSLVAGIYMCAVFAGMINLNLVLPPMIKVRPVFYRETAALFYSPWPYAFAVMTAELPWLALAIIVGPTFAYFMLGLTATAAAFWTHYLAVFLMGEHHYDCLSNAQTIVNYFPDSLSPDLTALGYGLLSMTAANALPTFELAQVIQIMLFVCCVNLKC